MPGRRAVRNENTVRNLAVFSHLLNVFHGYCHYPVAAPGNRESIRFHFLSDKTDTFKILLRSNAPGLEMLA